MAEAADKESKRHFLSTESMYAWNRDKFETEHIRRETDLFWSLRTSSSNCSSWAWPEASDSRLDVLRG
jgi:hypothetical protein